MAAFAFEIARRETANAPVLAINAVRHIESSVIFVVVLKAVVVVVVFERIVEVEVADWCARHHDSTHRINVVGMFPDEETAGHVACNAPYAWS